MIASGLLQRRRAVRILGWSLGALSRWRLPPAWKRVAAVTIKLYLLDSFCTGRLRRVALGSAAAGAGHRRRGGDTRHGRGQAERRLSEGRLSRRLQTTKVTLFKATERNPQLPEAVTAPLLAVADNGLGAVCERLRVIPLACHHHNILLCEEAIGKRSTMTFDS